MDVDTVASALGALGIGSLLGQYLSQYLSQGPSRRATRTDVLAALEECERSRWADATADAQPLVSATRKLESAAVISGLPSWAVDQYIVLAWAGYWTSYEDLEDAQQEGRSAESAGGIPMALSEVIVDAARDVSRLVWSPWRGRLKARAGLRERTSTIASLIAKRQDFASGTADLRAVARSLERAQKEKARHGR